MKRKFAPPLVPAIVITDMVVSPSLSLKGPTAGTEHTGPGATGPTYYLSELGQTTSLLWASVAASVKWGQG